MKMFNCKHLSPKSMTYTTNSENICRSYVFTPTRVIRDDHVVSECLRAKEGCLQSNSHRHTGRNGHSYIDSRQIKESAICQRATELSSDLPARKRGKNVLVNIIRK